MSEVISANRLADGIVVFFAGSGLWSPNLAEAVRFAAKEEADDALKLAKQDEANNLIVDPFKVAVKGEGSAETLSLRNEIRAKGPTVDYLGTDGQAAGQRS